MTNSNAMAGLYDIVESVRRVRLWSTLGWYDFTSRYHRTFIGPLWQTLIVVIWVSGLWFIFGHLFHRAGGDYPAYLAAGVVLWNYLSGTLSGSARVFTKNAKLILVVNNPLYTYVLRQVVENLAKLGFQSIVIVAALPFSGFHYDPVMFMVVPGLVAIVFASLWLVPLVGILGARFRDLSFALTSIMRFLFFTTPVFWRAGDLGPRAQIAAFNPFTHFLEVVRAPLLGGAAPDTSWLVVIGINVCGAIATLIVYSRFRRRIAFWL